MKHYKINTIMKCMNYYAIELLVSNLQAFSGIIVNITFYT